MEDCAFRSLKMYLEYLDTDKMRRSVKKIYLKYLEADKMRGKGKESVITPFNGPLVQSMVHSYSQQFRANQIFSDPEFMNHQ